MLSSLQFLVVAAISYTAFFFGVYAIVDIARRSPGAFTNAGKQSKTLWLIIIILATAILFISLPYPLGQGGGPFTIVGLIAGAVVIVYHVGVKPALGAHRRGPRGGNHNAKGGW